jgi:hypothetical protein
MRVRYLRMRLVLPVVLSLLAPVAAIAQSGPCELDANGELYCYSNNNPNMLESTCLSSADPQYCLPYHQRACQTGFAVACQMANLGQNCAGGDSSLCNQYVQILQANRACNLNGDQQSCQWLRQMGL